MEKLLNAEIEGQVKEFLAVMKNPMKIVVFTKETECQTCAQTVQLVEEVSELSDKISLEIKDINDEVAKDYNVTLTPSIAMLNSEDEYLGVKFNGIPAGHEFNSFLNAIVNMSGYDLDFDEKTIETIKNIKSPVDIKVFVTLSCPHCPGAVTTAHKIAMLNSNIEASMFEAQTFMELSNQYKVSGVPKIVINDKYELLGNQPVEAFLAELAKIN